jgi:hypothetical protein
VDYESHAVALDRNELGALLVAAGLGVPPEHALISLLALNGLRSPRPLAPASSTWAWSAAPDADDHPQGRQGGGHPAGAAYGPGDRLGHRRAHGRPGVAGRRRAAAGPHGAGRIVRKVARRAGIGKTVTPHTLRHAIITAALDAGVPLRDVQEAASHADPRTTMRYDRARGSLDRHATYIVAAYVAGAAR